MAKRFILLLECGHQALRTYIPKQAICDKCGVAREVESYGDLDSGKKIRPPRPDSFEGIVPP